MPAIKSAKKKLRQDKKRQLSNKKIKDTLKKAIKKAKEQPSEKTIREAFSATDKAVKNFIIHKNKGSRVKSSLSKLIAKKTPPKTPAEKKIQSKKSTKTA